MNGWNGFGGRVKCHLVKIKIYQQEILTAVFVERFSLFLLGLLSIFFSLLKSLETYKFIEIISLVFDKVDNFAKLFKQNCRHLLFVKLIQRLQ